MNDFLAKQINKIRNQELRYNLLAIFLVMLFLGCIGYLSSKFMSNDNDAPMPPIGRLGLYEPIYTFQKQYSRWPGNKEELEAFVEKSKMDATLNPYTKLLFHAEANGSLTVDYSFKSVGGVENGTYNFTKP